MKRFFLIMVGVICLQFTYSQVLPPINCLSAESICDTIVVVDTLKVAIDTTADEISAMSCLPHGEIRGTWYTMGANDTGYFRFTITPFDTLVDFDWALFRVDWGNCTDIYSVPEYEISCDNSGIGGGFYTTGASGLVQQGHQPAVHLTTPALFYLYVTTSLGDTDAVQGYTIDFSPSDMNLVNCNEIGIDEPLNASFSVYPNPTNDWLYVKTNHSGFVPDAYTIYTLTGQQITSQHNWNVNMGIDVSHYPAGIYLYRMTNESGKLVSGLFVVN